MTDRAVIAIAVIVASIKFNSDTPPEICFQWEEIHSPGDVKASKGSGKGPRYFPFTAEEFVRVVQEAEARGAEQGEVEA